MERVATCFKVKQGMQAEYKRRHDEIWAEMIELMKNCGIMNYSIWNYGELLFGYFEVDDYEKCLEILRNSDVKKRWDEYMADIIEVEKDPKTGLQKDMELMFLFEG
jgi:L-rhamnose mutarotase